MDSFCDHSPATFFAPLKQARLDYMVQKAVEMGAARIGAVMTQHTMVSRLNLERMQANAVEAAGILFKLHSAPMYFYRKGKGRCAWQQAAPRDQ